MLFIELDEGDDTLDDIKRICRHIAEHRELIYLMSDSQADDLSVILAPTLHADQDEDSKRAHWQRLLAEFEMKDAKGEPIRFYREPTTKRLYFANQKGIEVIAKQIEAEQRTAGHHESNVASH